jgi:hypothetical protein
MKWLLAAVLALALAGCAKSTNFDRENPIQLAAPIEQISPPTKLVPAASAETSKTHANESTNSSSLLECVSDACKIKCSPEAEKQSRPKWCAYFKEPIDRHAVSVTSDIQGKSTE